MNKLKGFISEGSVYGKIMLLLGVIMMIPNLVILFRIEEIEYIFSFAIPSVASISLGLIDCYIKKRSENETQEWQAPLQKGSIPVLFAWCYGFIIGAVPFVISKKLNIIQALFESVSGWTTTGLTVVDIEAMPHIFLFHRSFMQYCGGLGFILIMLMLVGGKQAVSMYNAEGHSDRLMPNLKKTVQTIFVIYNGFLLLGTFLYVIFGMNFFDAICHTMSALSTAGFSTKQNSIGQYNSYPIEVITIILMLIGSTNFAVLLLLTKFKFKKLLKVSELRFMFGMLAVFVPLIAFSLISEMRLGIFESFHQSLFGIVSIFTTTGYSTMNYAVWPPFTLGLIILLMIIGGSIGSTAGGIKLIRVHLMFKIVFANIKSKLSASRKVIVQNYYRAQGETPIDVPLIVDTFVFVFCYMMVFIVGTLLITIVEDCSLFDAMFEFSSALGTVGISNGITNTSTKAGTLIIEIIGMTLGRLEIFIVFIGIQAMILKLKKRIFR